MSSNEDKKCVICGEPTSHPQIESCEYCRYNVHFQVRNMAAGGISYFYEEEVYYHPNNWQTHPSVVARRQEVGGRVDMTSKWPGPFLDHVDPETVKTKATQCGFTEFHEIMVDALAEKSKIPKELLEMPITISGSYSAASRLGDILFKPIFEDDPPQTTHTFSAELPDGDVVTMPAPGDDWEEGETVDYKRGDMCVDDTDNDDLEWMRHHALVGKSRDRVIDFNTDSQKCWFKEFVSRLYYGTPILSITTWTRQPAPQPAKVERYDYYCPSKANTVGLEIWPDSGHVRGPLR